MMRAAAADSSNFAMDTRDLLLLLLPPLLLLIFLMLLMLLMSSLHMTSEVLGSGDGYDVRRTACLNSFKQCLQVQVTKARRRDLYNHI